MQIREVRSDDWARIWPFFRNIVAAGETYAYDAELTAAEAERLWMGEPGRHCVVACDHDDSAVDVVGTAAIYANRPGPGSHVASASFMVDPTRSGRGVGRALGEYAVDWARDHGYRAMQFNAVVETNTAAVKLWRSLGFEIIGTVPEAFASPTHGFVGLHIMHRRL